MPSEYEHLLIRAETLSNRIKVLISESESNKCGCEVKDLDDMAEVQEHYHRDECVLKQTKMIKEILETYSDTIGIIL